MRWSKVASSFDDDDECVCVVANTDVLTRAITAFKKGVGGSRFLQNRIGFTIRKAISAEKVSDSDRSTLLSFLSNGERQQYAPQSGEIIGILRRLNDEVLAELSVAQNVEAEREQTRRSMKSADDEVICTIRRPTLI